MINPHNSANLFQIIFCTKLNINCTVLLFLSPSTASTQGNIILQSPPSEPTSPAFTISSSISPCFALSHPAALELEAFAIIVPTFPRPEASLADLQMARYLHSDSGKQSLINFFYFSIKLPSSS